MTNWTTVDFQPAPPGWRAIYTYDNPDGTHAWAASPVAGWLIQKAPNDHRIIAGVSSGDDLGEVTPADRSSNLWRLLGPGEADPSPEEIAEERRYQNERPAPSV